MHPGTKTPNTELELEYERPEVFDMLSKLISDKVTIEIHELPGLVQRPPSDTSSAATLKSSILRAAMMVTTGQQGSVPVQHIQQPTSSSAARKPKQEDETRRDLKYSNTTHLKNRPVPGAVQAPTNTLMQCLVHLASSMPASMPSSYPSSQQEGYQQQTLQTLQTLPLQILHDHGFCEQYGLGPKSKLLRDFVTCTADGVDWDAAPLSIIHILLTFFSRRVTEECRSILLWDAAVPSVDVFSSSSSPPPDALMDSEIIVHDRGRFSVLADPDLSALARPVISRLCQEALATYEEARQQELSKDACIELGQQLTVCALHLHTLAAALPVLQGNATLYPTPSDSTAPPIDPTNNNSHMKKSTSDFRKNYGLPRLLDALDSRARTLRSLLLLV
jgi:hypothetical protein